MTEDDAGGSAAPSETTALRCAAEAHRVIEERGRDGLASLLADDFVQESRRGVGFRFDRNALLGTVRTMKELGMHVSGTPIAVAGDRWLVTRRVYHHGSADQQLLAVSVWNEDRQLARLIEFDVDDLDEALATLREVSGGQDVVMLSEPTSSD